MSRSRITALTRELMPNERFTAKSTIGIGTFGAVFLAHDKQTGEDVAIKKVCLDPRFKNRELELVERLAHPNVLHYVTHYTTKEGAENDVFLHLVTDYLPGSLSSFMSEYRFPPPIFLKVFGFQMFAALCYLHAHGVCHRDIKPSNVLVDSSTGRLELCDFGSGKFLKKNEPSVSYIATRNYRAPELLLDCQTYTTAIDVWAAGLVLVELVNGKPFFHGRNNDDLLLNIVKTIGMPKPRDFESFEHKKRFSICETKTSTLADSMPKWVEPGFLDLMSKVFVYDPTKRITAAQCMEHPYFQDIFAEDCQLPNKAKLPEYLQKMKTPREMLKNFPNGPSPPV